MTNPNHPAFLGQPKTFYLQQPPPDCDTSFGLTKREYFAAMAMQGSISGRYASNNPSLFHVALPELANEAVAIADALIAELNNHE